MATTPFSASSLLPNSGSGSGYQDGTVPVNPSGSNMPAPTANFGSVVPPATPAMPQFNPITNQSIDPSWTQAQTPNWNPNNPNSNPTFYGPQMPNQGQYGTYDANGRFTMDPNKMMDYNNAMNSYYSTWRNIIPLYSPEYAQAYGLSPTYGSSPIPITPQAQWQPPAPGERPPTAGGSDDGGSDAVITAGTPVDVGSLPQAAQGAAQAPVPRLSMVAPAGGDGILEGGGGGSPRSTIPGARSRAAGDSATASASGVLPASIMPSPPQEDQWQPPAPGERAPTAGRDDDGPVMIAGTPVDVGSLPGGTGTTPATVPAFLGGAVPGVVPIGRPDEPDTGTGVLPTPTPITGTTTQTTPPTFGDWSTGLPTNGMGNVDVGALLGGAPTSALSNQINDIWGSGIGNAVTNFLTHGAGYNPAVVSALTNAFTPFREEGLANIREAFGRSGAVDSSASALGQERFLRDMYLGDENILAGQYSNAVDRYSGMLTNLLSGAQANEANKLSPLDWLNGLLGVAGGLKGLFSSNATGNAVTVNVGGQPVSVGGASGGGAKPTTGGINIPSTPPTFPPNPGGSSHPSTESQPSSNHNITFDPDNPWPIGAILPDPGTGGTVTYGGPDIGFVHNVPEPDPISFGGTIESTTGGPVPGPGDTGFDDWFNQFLDDPYGTFGYSGAGIPSGGGSSGGGSGYDDGWDMSWDTGW